MQRLVWRVACVVAAACAALAGASPASAQCEEGPGTGETGHGVGFVYTASDYLNLSAGTTNNDSNEEIEECWTGVQAEDWIEGTNASDYRWDQHDADAEAIAFGQEGEFCGVWIGYSQHWYTWEKWDVWPFSHHTQWEDEGNDSDETDVDCGTPIAPDPTPLPFLSAEPCASGPAICEDQDGRDSGPASPGGRSPSAGHRILIVDLAGNGVDLTTPAGGVAFDADADGVRERVAWTAQGSDDALLVVDVNGNGTIDNGRELVGDGFIETGGATSRGAFEILTNVYRRAGRKNEARLDATYPFFGRMQLWVDANHDGRSDAGELRRLTDAGVIAIAAGYRALHDVDAAGNPLIYKGRVFISLRGVELPRDAFEVQLSTNGGVR